VWRQDQPLHLGLLRRIQQPLLVRLAPARLADQALGALDREALADIDHPGPAQPDLLGDRPIGQAALAKPDHLPPPLLLGRGRQLAHVHVPHDREPGPVPDQVKRMRAGSIMGSER
jgi:hypothetical protein